MKLFTGITAILLIGTIGIVEGSALVQSAAAAPTDGTLMALRRRRLSFRTGVRPSRFRVGGFSRGGECGGQQKLMAIVPPPQPQEGVSVQKTTVDKTTAARPTFFVYLPSLPAGSAQFTLQNEAGTQELYNVDFNLTGRSGIVGITLPNSAPVLQVGQKYYWQMAVACDPDQPSKLSIISSWVERVNPPATTQTDRLSTLAAQGIWYDVLSFIALQRYQQPNDRAAAEDWANLMQDAGLPQFKQAEIVQLIKK